MAVVAGGGGGGFGEFLSSGEVGDGAGVAVESPLVGALFGFEFVDAVGDGDGVEAVFGCAAGYVGAAFGFVGVVLGVHGGADAVPCFAECVAVSAFAVVADFDGLAERWECGGGVVVALPCGVGLVVAACCFCLLYTSDAADE